MALVSHRYGKGRVRVMRVQRDGALHSVRELSVQVMLQGAFGSSFTSSDNGAVIATDTIKNLVNIVAHEQLAAATEPFAAALAQRFLERYEQVARVEITTHETVWQRLVIAGQPHPHGFTLDGNGKPFVRLVATRSDTVTESGVAGLTFLKTTGSGWVGYVMDEVTTLPETEDRLCATAMDASWRWLREPVSYPTANAAIIATALDVFTTTYSPSVQNSLYRMGLAVLAVVPEIASITMACPNKHYLPVNLTPFDRTNRKEIFTPTDEPHGQIECTIARDDRN